MKITIEGEPKEIAALVLAVQERQGSGLFANLCPYGTGGTRDIRIVNDISGQDTGGKG